MGPLYAAFKLAMELSPIMLTNGLAVGMPGGILPIIAITEAAHFTLGLLSGAENIELDDFFAHFRPVPGSTLIDNVVATFPFANQAVAGNAVIRNALTLSMQMICPARDVLGYADKLLTMTALKQTLDQHIMLGGTFTVITPAQIYVNGLLVRMVDASFQQSQQAQNTYQLDFFFPLLTLESAQQVQNNLISQITAGSQMNATNGAVGWTGVGPTVGNPNSLAGGEIIPSSSGIAVTTSPFIPPGATT